MAFPHCLFRAKLAALAFATALPASFAERYLYYTHRDGGFDEALELARFDFAAERLDGPRVIPEVSEPEAFLSWRGRHVLIVTQSRAVLHDWETATTRTLFDAAASPDGPNGSPQVFVDGGAVGTGLALLFKSSSAGSYTAVYHSATGERAGVIDGAYDGVFDHAGERLLLWGDGARIWERNPDGTLAETGALNAVLDGVPQYVDLDGGFAVQQDGTYVPTDGSSPEFTFGLEWNPGSGGDQWIEANDRFYVFRSASAQVEAYDSELRYLGAAVVDMDGMPSSGAIRSLAWADGRLFVAALNRDGTNYRDPVLLTYAEVDVQGIGTPWYRLREFRGLNPLPAGDPEPDAAHTRDGISVVLFRSHFGIYDWSALSFSMFLERPPVDFDRITTALGGGFFLWSSQTLRGALYYLDLAAREVRGWGGGSIADANLIHSVQPLSEGRALVFLRRNSSVHGSTGEVLIIDEVEGVLDRAGLEVRYFLGAAGDTGGEAPEGAWIITTDGVHKLVAAGQDGVLRLDAVDAGPGVPGFVTQVVAGRSPDGHHDLVLAQASGPAYRNGRLAVVDRADGAFVTVEGPWVEDFDPEVLWMVDGAAVFYGGELVRFRYDGMQVSADPVPEYPFTGLLGARRVGAPLLHDGRVHWWMWDFPFGSLFPADEHDLDGLSSPLDNVGGGRWRVGTYALSRSLGSYHTQHAPWYYFEPYGYGFSPLGHPEWVYFPYVGWLWTREGVFPRFYSADFGGWLRYRYSDGPVATLEHVMKRYRIDTAPGWVPLDFAQMVLHFDFEGDEETWTFSNNIAAKVRYFDDEDGEWVSVPLRLEIERLDADTLRLHVASGIYIEGEYTLTFRSAFGGEADGELRVYGVNRVLLHVESGSGTFTVDR